jgi:hypothetical protein
VSLFHLEIALVGDAFTPEPRPELVRLVRSLADRLEDDGLTSSGSLIELNGNTCGTWWLEGQSTDRGATDA